MSVFKRPDSSVYSYDFRFQGRRFSGSTECTTKRDAARFEENVKRQAKANVIETGPAMTVAEGAALYWIEVGQHHADPKATLRNLGWFQTNIGKTTLLSDISDATVARLAAKRRGETRSKKEGKKSVEVPIANATVNRSVVEPLNRLLTRAGRVWGVHVQTIDWRRHKLKEPQERVREASPIEENIVLTSIREDYRPAVTFALKTGCRRAEIVGLTWQDVDFFNREFRVTGKGDRSRTIPMTDEVYDLLWTLKDHHNMAVFTYVARRTNKKRKLQKGQRYPITPNGFQSMWNRYGRGKLADFRFHDTRHTAATRLVRATGNLKMAQRLLGHSSLATTSRYAHVTHDDLRKGMEAAAQTKTATPSTTPGADDQSNELMPKRK